MSNAHPEPMHVANVWLVATDRKGGHLVSMNQMTRHTDHHVDLPAHLTSPTLVLSARCSCGEVDRDAVVLTTREPVTR